MTSIPPMTMPATATSTAASAQLRAKLVLVRAERLLRPAGASGSAAPSPKVGMMSRNGSAMSAEPPLCCRAAVQDRRLDLQYQLDELRREGLLDRAGPGQIDVEDVRNPARSRREDDHAVRQEDR